MKQKNLLAVVEELAASIKSKFHQWHSYGVKNARGLILSILVLTPLFINTPTILAPLYHILVFDSFGL